MLLADAFLLAAHAVEGAKTFGASEDSVATAICRIVASESFLSSVTLLGSVASVVALFQAGRVWRRMREMERSYLQQQFLPKHAERLKAHLKNLKTSQTQKNRDKAERHLAECDATLQSIEELLRGSDQQTVTQARSQMKCTYSAQDADSDFLSNLPAAIAVLAGIAELMGNAAEQQPWRRTDAN